MVNGTKNDPIVLNNSNNNKNNSNARAKKREIKRIEKEKAKQELHKKLQNIIKSKDKLVNMQREYAERERARANKEKKRVAEFNRQKKIQRGPQHNIIRRKMINAHNRGNWDEFQSIWNKLDFFDQWHLKPEFENMVRSRREKMANAAKKIQTAWKNKKGVVMTKTIAKKEKQLNEKYGPRTVQKLKRSMAKKELQNAKENRQITEFKYNLAKPLKIKVSAKDAKRIKAQKKSDDYKKLLRKVKFNAPRSLTHITYNLHPRFNEIKNSTYGKNTPESERVKIYEGWVRQLKKSDIKNHRHSHLFTGINPEWINSFIAKLNAEEKAKANAKAKEKANEIARKEERKRERDEKRKKKENEKREKNAMAGLKKLRKS